MGSDCFYYSVLLNRDENATLPPDVSKVIDEKTGLKLAHFESFTSRAVTSLGASQPSSTVLQMALRRKGGIRNITVSDRLSMDAALRFAGREKMICLPKTVSDEIA